MKCSRVEKRIIELSRLAIRSLVECNLLHEKAILTPNEKEDLIDHQVYLEQYHNAISALIVAEAGKELEGARKTI